VFPEAGLKFFLDATPAERARRRVAQLRHRGEIVDPLEIQRQIEERDARDRGRKVAPLAPAADARVVDTTVLSQDDVIEIIVAAAAAMAGTAAAARPRAGGSGRMKSDIAHVPPSEPPPARSDPPPAWSDPPPRLPGGGVYWHPNRGSVVFRVTQLCCRIAFTTLLDMKVYGARTFPRTGGVLIVCNHQSFLDPLLIGTAAPRALSAMAKSELFENRCSGG
jgi:hypothetical protein